MSGTLTQQTPVSEELRHDAHVVVLVNYLRRHHVAAFHELSKRVRKLTILLSVPMEPDRSWEAEWQDLDVQVQKNWMFTTSWKHPSGFSEPNFIHVPVDTIRRLRKLKPDVVLSYEMGMRTFLSTIFRRFNRSVPLVMVGNMSNHIEQERGVMRRLFRKLICRGVDYFTYNGPSCRDYLKSLGISEDRLSHVPYCIDDEIVFTGERSINQDTTQPLRLLYCGAISERKGIVEFSRSLANWCKNNPQRPVNLAIAGSGSLRDKVESISGGSLSIEFLGNCDLVQVRDAYQAADICVFPTLADEWGLVPIEAMASGIPVLGSIYAQSVEACCVEGRNGWIFDPMDNDSMAQAIDRAMNVSPETRFEMGQHARESVADITASTSADCFLEVVRKATRKNTNSVGSVPALKEQTV